MKQIIFITLLIIQISVVQCVEITKIDASEQEQWGYSTSRVKSRLLKKNLDKNKTVNTQNQQKSLQENDQENELETNQETIQQNKEENVQETIELPPIDNIFDNMKEDINTVQDYLGDLPIQQEDQNFQATDIKNQKDIQQESQIDQENDSQTLESENSNQLDVIDQADQKVQPNVNQILEEDDTQNLEDNDVKNLEIIDEVVEDSDYEQTSNELVQPIVVIFQNLRKDIENIEILFADLKVKQEDQKHYANDAKALEIIDIIFQNTGYGEELKEFGQSFYQLLTNIGKVHNQFEQYVNETQDLKVKLEDLNSKLDFKENQEKVASEEFLSKNQNQIS